MSVLLGSFHLKKRFLSQDTNIEVLRHDEWFGGSALTELVSRLLLIIEDKDDNSIYNLLGAT